MSSDVAEVAQVQRNPFAPKVHEAICCELMKVSEKVVSILPAIESARPGSSSGIQVLCSLNNALEKAKLLVHYCSESSKMYLVITADSITSRCARILTQLNQSLQQVQNMVPPVLASKIAKVLECIRDVKFVIDPREQEAGTALLNLLAQTESSEEQELKTFQIVALRLNIISSIGLLVERRSIRKLLDRFCDVDTKKERTLKYFLYLINKYAKQLKHYDGEHQENLDTVENCLNLVTKPESDAHETDDMNQPSDSAIGVQSESPNGDMPPKEYFCPISGRLMYDPVVISSGQTYERMWILKWLEEGHDTCPKTRKSLTSFSLTPNSCMKDLISNWCRRHGVTVLDPCVEVAALESWQPTNNNSVSSLKNVSTALLDGTMGACLLDESKLSNMSSTSYINTIQVSSNKQARLFTWSNDYKRFQSFLHFNQDMYLRFLSELSGLPASLQENAMESMKNLLEGDECSKLFNGFLAALMLFMKQDSTQCNVEAQRCGAQLLLSVVTNERWESELTCVKEDLFQLLNTLLDGATYKETLMILQKLVHLSVLASDIATSNIPIAVQRFLGFEDEEHVTMAVEILSELSSHSKVRLHFLSSGCLEKLARLLSDGRQVLHCLNILQNLVDCGESSRVISDANGCIGSIAEILETGNHEEQEQAVIFLLSSALKIQETAR
ncbi:hypothetical protein HPP92_021826 [Vanilla planifolia]|uniref:RING-type E3 ubiquitin transferase n=1 Tax=Vanilla planifolia TaxID=51239 RepID=A0A835UFV7_VANPL|nr:hypothetical protein HPP92_021826 [Vanilla planifolia]